jgi:putative two-component system response regulator
VELAQDARSIILVVDDTPENIDVISGILKTDYQVRFATSGTMALQVVQKVRPDLILLDVMMPQMDGYQVCRALKANPSWRWIPVIFVTALSEDVDEAYGFEVGAVDYITKPVSPLIVKSRVRTHLTLADVQKDLAAMVEKRTVELNATQHEIIRILGRAAEYKDNETGMHVLRMSKICYLIGQAYGLDPRELHLLETASPMHDIGKIGIPDHILGKPGRLDVKERAIIEQHAKIGSNIIGPQTSELLRMATIIADQHHEKWDGTGYPLGLRGEEIHLFPRIVAVADVFDALTSRRPYKEAWNFEDAVELIQQERGRHFDAEVVDKFISVLPQIRLIVKDFEG